MSPFRHNQKADCSRNASGADQILDDLMRGVEGRKQSDNYLPRNYVEDLDALEAIGFAENSGQNFLGVIKARTDAVIRADGRTEFKTAGGVAVGCLDDRHITTVAGSRSGKGRSVIIPNLLSYPGSMVVVDPKGENASITSRYRSEQLGQNVCVLDPFEITADQCAPYRKRFNPLSILSLESPTLVEDAGLIADALVVSTNTKDSHWDDSARSVIEGLLLHVVTEHTPTQRDPEPNLLAAAELLSGRRLSPEDGMPMSINQVLGEMLENRWLDNRIAAAAQSLKDKPDSERGSIISTARKNLKFLDYDAMGSVLSGHDFDLGDLKTKPTTIYLVLPAMRMNTCKQWLRLFVNLILATVERVNIRPKHPVIMVLDEMPVLGYMRELESAIGQVAGLGLRLHCILQDLGQLKALYKDRYETFLGNSGILQFFGNIDQFTCEVDPNVRPSSGEAKLWRPADLGFYFFML